MDSINAITRDEFIKDCTKKLQTGRMLSLSALFTPYWNTYNFFPQIQIDDIKNIKSKLSKENIAEAKKIFIAICVYWYQTCWSKFRPNCINIIKNCWKDALMKDENEAHEIKKAIISELVEIFTKANNDLAISELRLSFPDIKIDIGTKQETSSDRSTKNNIIDILKRWKSCKQDTLVEQAANDLIQELCENTKKIEIKQLQTQLSLLEKVECEKEKIQKVVILLLTSYFFDWKNWIIYMIKDINTSDYNRSNLIEKYQIPVDPLIQSINTKQWWTTIVEWKNKILINSFTTQQREESQIWIARLYKTFDENYAKWTYAICILILDKLNIEKRYPDIKEKRSFLYDNQDSRTKNNKLIHMDESIEKWERQEAIKFAYTLCKWDNYYYLAIAYKKIYSRYKQELSRLWDLENIFSQIKQSEIKEERAIITNIAIAIINLCLDFKQEHKLQNTIEDYIKETDLKDKDLQTIFDEQIKKFLDTLDKKTIIFKGIYFPRDLFLYIDSFPKISKEQKKQYKLDLIVKLNKQFLTIENFVNQPDKLIAIQTTLKEINKNNDLLWLENIVNNDWEMSTEQKFIFGDICGKVEKSDLEDILKNLLTTLSVWYWDWYTYIIDIIKKYWKKYDIQIWDWVEKVFNKALNKKDFDYSEKILKQYPEYFEWKNNLEEIKEKRILEKIETTNIEKITIKEILFNKTTTRAFSTKINDTKISTDNLEFIISLYEEPIIGLPTWTMDTVEIKILNYFDQFPQTLKTDYSNTKRHFLLTKKHRPLSDNHFSTAIALYRYYDTKILCQEAIDLCDEMLIVSKEYQEKKNDGKYLEDWGKLKNKTIKYKYSMDYNILLRSIQALRPLPENLYKDTKNTLTIWEIEPKIQELYEFAIKYSINQKTIQNIITLWKDFCIYTQNTERPDRLKGVERYSIDNLKNQLTSFLNDKNNLGVKQLEELILFFGMENAADILFQLYPQYKPLWALFIKSIISQYLGNFLLQRNWYRFVAIPEILQLWSKEMVDRIFTVTEKWFINYYTKTKKKFIDMTDREICENYLVHSKQEFDKIRANEPVFDDILKRFSEFLNQILAIKKSDRFINKLQSWRDFPDFLQKLNAALIQSKKRFLIADGMGMWKSLSAILAKESIWAKNCLIVTPSNVVNTRKNYLSDINIPKEKKQWYFSTWKAPKVLVVETAEDIKNKNLQDYEYIIISQEKLSSDTYLQPLVDTNFDYMIVDEIHKLKNVSKGKRANSLLQIAEKIEQKDGFLCLLSWTPIPNKVWDIAMLLKLLYPHEYGNTNNKELVKSILAWDTLNLRSLLLPRMQMKKITDHIDMPELFNKYENFNLSEKEQFYYDTILADDEMSASEKIIKLRQFILNPRLLWITDIPASSKAKNTWKVANDLFKEKNKVVFFVNSFISWILRPTEWISNQETFIAQMWLDPNIEIKIIDWETKHEERNKIQTEFNSNDKKTALFVSWATADVGIDLTWWEYIMHINEPRTQADKDQQEARVYRPGQNKDIETTAYITNNTIEQWIHEYVKIKQDAIMKLYYGIELSILEKRILESDDPWTSAETWSEKEINKWLSTYFKESAKELNNMYGYLKQAWSSNVESLVLEHWEKFAWYYKALWPRSYQANTNRLNASIIKQLISQNQIQNPNIIDMGSGPKMLYHNIADDLKEYVTSIDINPHHFTKQDIDTGKAKIGNFLSLPCPDWSVDMISSSLAFNETSRDPKEGNYERLSCLLEIQRILKKWWYAVISTIYSLQYEDKEKLKTILDILWFEIYEKYSWIAGSKDQNNIFHAKIITIRKKDDKYKSLDEILVDLEEKKLLNWLSMKIDKVYLKNQKNVLQEAEIWDTRIQIELNKEWKTTLGTENAYLGIVKELENKWGSIQKIPDNIIREYWFARYSNNKSRVICASLPNNAWLFTYRKAIKTQK